MQGHTSNGQEAEGVGALTKSFGHLQEGVVRQAKWDHPTSMISVRPGMEELRLVV